VAVDLTKLTFHRELGALARALRHHLAHQRDVLRVADSHRIAPGALVADTERELVARLRTLSIDALASIARVLPASALAEPPRDLSLERVARFVLSYPGRGPKLDAVERAVIAHALEVHEGNQSAAARALGMHRKALVRRLTRDGA
jgi:transcriptional regulator of acetoin/glycerol metabolism